MLPHSIARHKSNEGGNWSVLLEFFAKLGLEIRGFDGSHSKSVVKSFRTRNESVFFWPIQDEVAYEVPLQRWLRPFRRPRSRRRTRFFCLGQLFRTDLLRVVVVVV